MDKMEFVFVNNGEFGNYYYEILLNYSFCGSIDYDQDNNYWEANVFHGLRSADCFIVGNKLNELNESLAKQRKEYFGLI